MKTKAKIPGTMITPRSAVLTVSLAALAAFALFSGCASTGKANLGKPIDPETNSESASLRPSVEISCELSEELSSEYFGYLDFNFANPSGEWRILTDLKISFADPAQNANVSVVLGRNLDSWYQAQSKSMDISRYNRSLAAGILGGAGMGVAALSGEGRLGYAGAAAAAGAVSYLAAREIGANLDSLQMAKFLPANHLLADTMAVPPGLFADRWLLLNSRNHDSLAYITEIFIEYKADGGKTEKQKIGFRKKEKAVVAGKWQHSIYRREAEARADHGRAGASKGSMP